MQTEHAGVTELTSDQVALVSGGVVPLVAVAYVFGKSVVAGYGVAAAAHGTYKAYQLLAK